MSAVSTFAAEQEVGKMNAFFSILPTLGNRWAKTRPWEGSVIGLNLHLTTITAALVRELILGGGVWIVSAANEATTDPATVELLRNVGVQVYTGGDLENRFQQVLEHEPDLLVDVGFELLDTLLDKRPDHASSVKGAVELTRSGITRLRRRENIPFPVININDGRLKNAVENRHGVGEAVWQAVTQLTGIHLAGRRVLVIGYGPVGRGLAHYARAAGTSVEVIESDPVARLFAHYDGFPTPSLEDGLSRAALVVTATGQAGALTLTDLEHSENDLILVNAGHGGDEIDVEGIERAAVSKDNVARQVARYRLESGQRVSVLGAGHPLNIVLNSGSPEPVLLHFAVLGLSLERLATSADFANGENIVSDDIERSAAQLALQALDPVGR
jgi:adenosylhomocysteinase